MNPPAATADPTVQLPEPARFWIRFAPRAWPAAAGPRLDLARGALAAGRPGIAVPAVAGPLDDLLYLPAVPPDAAALRDDQARRHLAAGTPVLVHLAPGETGPAGAVGIYDLLEPLLQRDLDLLTDLPAGATAVWPLLPGLTDAPDLWEAGCARLAVAGAARVQTIVPELDPAARRRLVELCGEAAFDALFHGEPPSRQTERDFARVAHAHGLAPFLPRPLPGPAVLRRENREIAGLLALAGELWLRLGRPAGQGEALYGAARQADRTHYDLRGLAREGNLGALGWLDPLGRAAVEEWARRGAFPLLDELLAAYLSPLGLPTTEDDEGGPDR